jgi:hypothetical protein
LSSFPSWNRTVTLNRSRVSHFYRDLCIIHTYTNSISRSLCSFLPFYAGYYYSQKVFERQINTSLMNTYTGESDDAAKVASVEEQLKTLQDHVQLLLSRNVNAEKETDKLRKERHGSVNNHIKICSMYCKMNISVMNVPTMPSRHRNSTPLPRSVNCSHSCNSVTMRSKTSRQMSMPLAINWLKRWRL